MDIVKCPFCDGEIESDSFFCDQCGQELRVCPIHGFKKGKICNECGTKLTEARNAAAGDLHLPPPPPPMPTTPPVTHVPAAAPAGTTSQDSDPEKTVRPQAPPVEPKHLVSAVLGARLELRDGAVAGRRTGDYTHVFSSQGYVSGTHARFQKNGERWEVVDLDSSNGTFLNGTRLAPNTPAAFAPGDTIAFYDLKFTVE